MSINRVNISGNLTRDAELRASAAGTPILSLGVAVNDRRKNPSTGEWEDVPNFIDCVLFGNRATALAPYLSKGSKVAIEGKLRYSTWETQEGQKRSKIEVIIDEIELMGARQSQQAQQAPVAAVPPKAAAPAYPGGIAPAVVRAAKPAPKAAPADVYDEDIPF
jgi:single-strand DNA-binding protein